ncbi:uncharacterized protein LOC136093135 [Hydra vulgaris]|uniref:uncharacterized protein LOC136093135 n=1 Tax=Hydra vulgaris TaxID=6087 RepID=UPI0032EA4CA5
MFFNIIDQVYNFFSASTKRWLILQSKCPSLTVKPLSDTRWESHINAVKTLRFEMPKIYKALQDAAKTANETIAKITAESIALKITSFDILCSIVIWHKVLFEINLTSKQFQAASTNISEALKAMEKTINFFKENYKQEKFDFVVCIAQELASFLKVEESFAAESASRVRKRKRFFDEPEQNFEKQLCPKEKYKQDVFNKLVECATIPIKKRFNDFNAGIAHFSFLFDIKKLSTVKEDNLKSHCIALKKNLKMEKKIFLARN